MLLVAITCVLRDARVGVLPQHARHVSRRVHLLPSADLQVLRTGLDVRRGVRLLSGQRALFGDHMLPPERRSGLPRRRVLL